MAYALDRIEVIDIIKSLLIGDTTILYGQDKLIKFISSNPIDYEASKVDVNTPYKMYLYAPSREPVEVRAQNEDYAIIVNYNIEGVTRNPDTAYARLDDIDKRINYLCNNQMWTGDNLSTFFTNANCTIIDIEVQTGETNIVSDQGYLQCEAKGSIRVVINYQKY
jgi:hypothetical protein